MLKLVTLWLLVAILAAAQTPATPPATPTTTPPANQTPPQTPGSTGKPLSSPFIPIVTGTKATVTWITDYSPVRYGRTTPDVETNSFRVNQAIMTGVEGGQIHYEIPGVGNGTFHLPPAPGAASEYSFVLFGDNRTRHDIYRQVADEITALKPTFIVHTGDLVANGNAADMWATFFDISRDLLRNTVFYPSLGNHESNTPYWYQFFNQKAGYYSFDWGRTHWAVLNTNNVAPNPEAYWAEQLAWLENDLEKNKKADFLFTVFHHTPYSVVLNRQDAAARIAARLVPIFKKYKISGAFAGHDHNYQHHEAGGIPYIVTGGGGAPLYNVDVMTEGLTKTAEKVENYVVCRTLGISIHCEAKALGGRVIDRFDFTPRKQ